MKNIYVRVIECKVQIACLANGQNLQRIELLQPGILLNISLYIYFVRGWGSLQAVVEENSVFFPIDCKPIPRLHMYN